MESLAKILEFLGKYAWAVCVTIAFVIFVPEDAARQLGIAELRAGFRGPLWILLVLTAVLSLGALFQYVDRRLIDGWLKHKRELQVKQEERRFDAEAKAAARREEEREQQEAEQKRFESLVLRLSSLDLEERMWFKYCLFHNVQTLSAERGNRIAQSLCHKGLVAEGSGHVLNLPFHIPDRVWRHLVSNKDTFLLPSESSDPRFPSALENFRKSLWASY